MKNITRLLCAGTMALGLAGGLAGCAKDPINEIIFKRKLVQLEGEVISENYQKLARGNSYSFIIDTPYGKKVLEIAPSLRDPISKGAVDSFINVGDKIRLNIWDIFLGSNYFTIPADDFLRNVTVLQ